MAESEIRPGIYQHFKGKRYRVLGIATDATNPEPGSPSRPPIVICQQDYVPYALCYRSIEDFLEEVDRPEHGYRGPRFAFVQPF